MPHWHKVNHFIHYDLVCKSYRISKINWYVAKQRAQVLMQAERQKDKYTRISAIVRQSLDKVILEISILNFSRNAYFYFV